MTDPSLPPRQTGADLGTVLDTLTPAVAARAGAGEGWSLHLAGESSSFVRLNRGRVRQPGAVHQVWATLRWFRGTRQAMRRFTLTGRASEDRARVEGSIGRLRLVVGSLEEDPHFLRPPEPRSTERIAVPHEPTPPAAMVDTLLEAAAGHDVVGILASGLAERAYADDRGQRNVFAGRSTLLDFSVYRRADKAVKAQVAAPVFDAARFTGQIRQACERSLLLDRAERTVAPGPYRAYLSPGAVGELWSLAQGDGFGLRAVKARRSPLVRLHDGRAHFDDRISVVDDIRGDGEPPAAPDFSPDGWVRPGLLPLIARGRAQPPLASGRTAAEHGVVATGVSEDESPTSFAMEGGQLAEAEAIAALDTGLYITDLWYSNWSDRTAARLTAMTRFATMWVEGGQLVAPVKALRFDDSLYRMLGESLVDLTRERSLLLDSGTYGQRSLGYMLLPGVLLSRLEFTL